MTASTPSLAELLAARMAAEQAAADARHAALAAQLREMRARVDAELAVEPDA